MMRLYVAVDINYKGTEIIMMNKKCPKCGRIYGELSNYCTKCGVELEKTPNKCSENKTTLCSHRVYSDDDLYCEYCGALTTYGLERVKSNTDIK